MLLKSKSVNKEVNALNLLESLYKGNILESLKQFNSRVTKAIPFKYANSLFNARSSIVLSNLLSIKPDDSPIIFILALDTKVPVLRLRGMLINRVMGLSELVGNYMLNHSCYFLEQKFVPYSKLWNANV